MKGERKHASGPSVIQREKEKAPIARENFVKYVEDGHYDNTLFHRVIDGFMVQGGGMEPGMMQKPTRKTIAHEGANGLKNKKYTLAMARTGDPHSASSQFFINSADNDVLDLKSPGGQGWGYCVFGKVVGGTDVVDKIRKVDTATSGLHENVPKEDVVLEHAEVLAA